MLTRSESMDMGLLEASLPTRAGGWGLLQMAHLGRGGEGPGSQVLVAPRQKV